MQHKQVLLDWNGLYYHQPMKRDPHLAELRYPDRYVYASSSHEYAVEDAFYRYADILCAPFASSMAVLTVRILAKLS